MLYAGSRGGSGNVMLFSGSTQTENWQAETAFTGIPVTDVLVTPGLGTEAWVSTFGSPPSYNGPVLGRAAGGQFTPRGTLRSWFMSLAATGSGVFVAVSKPDDRGVYRWDDAQGDWVRLGGATIDTVVFRALEAGPDGALWLATDSRGLWRSGDSGSTWLTSSGSADWTVWSVAVSPDDAGIVLAGLGRPDGAAGVGGYAAGLRRSVDGGLSWLDASPSLLAGTDDETVTALAFSRRTAGLAFASGWKSGLFVSRDGGASWLPYGTPVDQQRYFEALLLLPVTASCELLYAAGSDGIWVRNLADAPHAVYLPANLQRAGVR
jgi:hypothetical protein